MYRKSAALEQSFLGKYRIEEYCPYCHSLDVAKVGHLHYEMGKDGEPCIYQNSICYDCGGRWYEVYRLQRLETLMRGYAVGRHKLRGLAAVDLKS